MDLLKKWNDAAAYIERNLCDGIRQEELARITCCPAESFNRFFSFMTSSTVTEYVRKRRLTRAAYELRRGSRKVIDIALDYGYNSVDAFTKAFRKQHGVTPAQMRSGNMPVKAYLPVSFHIQMKGAEEMSVQIMDKEELVLHGLSKPFSGGAAQRFEQEQRMWAEEQGDFMEKISAEIPGVWYGVWNSGTYSIAKETQEMEGLAAVVIPAGTYAVVTSGSGGFAGSEIPKLRANLFDAGLADAGLTQANDMEIEVYHLFSKEEKQKRFYELWIPVLRT